MPRKRRHPKGSNGQCKRPRQDASRLLSLPPELIDQVIGHLLPWPNQFEHSCHPATCVRDLFTSPVLQVCRDLRLRGLGLIATDCIWISVNANNRDAALTLSKIATFDFPNIPHLFRGLLPEKIPSAITFTLGDEDRPEKSTRRFSADTTPLLFPYNYNSLLRLCTLLGRSTGLFPDIHIGIPRGVTCNKSALFVQWIRPVLETCKHAPFSVTLTVEGRSHQLEKRAIGAKSQPLYLLFVARLRFLIRECYRILKTADDMESAGHRDEAAVWLCHRGLTISDWADTILPIATDWRKGETHPEAEFALTDLDACARNAFGNHLRSMVHRIEYRACLSYWGLYERYGGDFIEHHQEVLADCGLRWWNNRDRRHFGLSQEELSEVAHAKAIVCNIKVLAHDNIHGEDTSYHLPPRDRRGPNGFAEYPYDDKGRGLLQMSIACRLQPENEEYRRLYGVFWAYPIDWRDDGARDSFFDPDPEMVIADFVTDALVHLPGTSEPVVWMIDASLLSNWGGDPVLSYLPLARKQLSHDELDRCLNEPEQYEQDST